MIEGPTPRLIDEWQIVPKLWNQVRRTIDDRKLPGQFILTGSAVPPDDETRHVGAGRITRIRLRPMSLFESGHSSGDISLKALLDGDPVLRPTPAPQSRRSSIASASGAGPPSSSSQLKKAWLP